MTHGARFLAILITHDWTDFLLNLQSGRMSLSDVQRTGNELRAAGACLQACMVQLADCLENKQKYSA